MSRKGARIVSIVATLLCVIVMPSFAITAQVTQEARAPRIPAVNDNIVVELVGKAIVEKSSSLFMRAAREGTQIPIEVTLPTGATSFQWQAFLDHLMLSLRGRSLQTPDNFKRIIDASGVAFSRDTIRATIDVGIRSRCRGRWIADGTSYEVTWIRYGNTEDWVRVRNETQIAYDSFGCPVDPP